MQWLITDELMEQARQDPAESGLSREERRAICNDRMLEVRAANQRYRDGRSVKETVDEILRRGGVPSFARSDELGRAYAKMAKRRLKEEPCASI